MAGRGNTDPEETTFITSKLSSFNLRRQTEPVNDPDSVISDSTDSLLQPSQCTNTACIQTQITRITRTGSWIIQQAQNQNNRSRMGYDVERFTSSVNDGLLCCICRDVLEDPLQAPCEHAFCTSCIRAWLVHHSICPEDRQPLILSDLRPLFRYMKNDLDRLQIRCANTQDGCSVICNLELIHRHEEECQFSRQECPSVGCTLVLERRQMADHLPVCEFRMKECAKGCGLQIVSTEDTQHNCIAELRTSLELLQSEMICKLTDQRQELELRLDAQRRHMVQKQASLVSMVENLKSQMSHVLQDVKILQDAEKRHEEELDRAALEKRELLNIIAQIQNDSASPSGASPRKYFCRQGSRQDK